MAAAATMRTEHIAETPRGWRVRMKAPGPQSEHLVAIAYPPGRRKKGSGRLVEILHPAGERNPKCSVSEKARTNPGELLIFGNPTHMQVSFDPGIKKYLAVIYDPKFGNLYASGFTKKQAAHALHERVREARRTGTHRNSSAAAKRATRERAARIRSARLNPKGGFGNHKKGCHCVFCEHQRKIATADQRMPKPIRDVMRSNPRRRRKDRRNPDETQAAVRLFEKFHGRDPKEITEKHISAAHRKDYTALGDLEHLKVLTPLGQTAQFNFHDDGVKLASSPDGKQLYCIGGNQNLSQCLDHDSLEKDFIDLGEATEVQYLARKIHGNFEPISYFHKFGEKTGARPQLAYDKLKKQIFFVGGEYFIDTKQGVSPGIEN